jgi:sugar lactone lactonase YvrE
MLRPSLVFTKIFTAAFGFAAVVAVVVGSASCGGGLTSVRPAMLSEAANDARVDSPSQQNAIYISDQTGYAVDRYLLNPDGTLPTQPTSSMGGIKKASSIAIGTDGNIYVLSYKDGLVQVYPAGATGNPSPLWVLDTRFHIIAHSFALDRSNYLYAGGFKRGSGGGAVAVYAPDASGPVKPLRYITPPGGHGVTGVALDRTGNLFVADSASQVSEFTTPETNPALLRTVVGSGQLYPESMVIDAGGELYVATYGSNGIAVYSPAANGNASPDRVISSMTTPLYTRSYLALKGETLYATGGAVRFRQPYVWVFDATQGSQVPKQVLPVMLTPGGAAIGP